MPAFRAASALLATALLVSAPASAQSSLGLGFLEASVGLGDSGGYGRVAGDWRTGPAHGVQLGLDLAESGGWTWGQVDGYLYMSPGEDRKYGFAASAADANDREASVVTAGVAGMWRASPSLVVQGSARLGYARPGAIDFVSVSGRADLALGDRAALFASGSVAWIEEAALSGRAATGRIGLSVFPGAGPVELHVAAVSDVLSGFGAADGSDTGLEAGVTVRLGPSAQARRPVAETAFDSPKVFDPLIRRRLF